MWGFESVPGFRALLSDVNEGRSNAFRLCEAQEEGDRSSQAEEERLLAQDREDEDLRYEVQKASPDEVEDDFEESNVDGALSGGEALRPRCGLASYALSSLQQKIPRPEARLDLEAEQLIGAATSSDELAQMYEGWTSWI